MNKRLQSYGGNVAVWIVAVVTIAIGIIAVTGQDLDYIRNGKPKIVAVIVPEVGARTENEISLVNGFSLALSEDMKTDIVVEYIPVSCNAQSAGVAIEQFLTEYQPEVFISFACPEVNRTVSALASERALPLVITNKDSFALESEYSFNVLPHRDELVSFMGTVLHHEGIKKLGILTFSESEFRNKYMPVLRDTFEVASSSISFITSLEEIASASSTLEELIASSEVDALLVADTNSSLLDEISTLDPLPRLFFFHDGISSAAINDFGESLKGAYVLSHTYGSFSFGERYRLAYDTEPDVYASYGYDTFRLVGDAVRGGVVKGTSTVVLLENTHYFGASGEILFTDTQSRTALFDVSVINDGALVRLPQAEQESFREYTVSTSSVSVIPAEEETEDE
ncbi:MAG: hypothetical protein WDZ88_03450 [Candidatus Paceibacterota bacterium]